MKQTDHQQLGAQEILANRMISLADLRGRKEAAAARLRVSIATFRRKSREHGINHRWPDLKKIFDSSTKIDSIAEILETLTIVPVIDHESAMSTVCRNPNPLVSVQPQVPLTQMASENLGSFDDGRTYLALQAQQDTWFVMIKAMYGKDTILLFPFLVASGIIGLKGEVSKRLKFEVDSFDVKCKDLQGHLISIACDDDLMSYLNVFKPLGYQPCRLFVISKIPN
ncbi:hypothetical protein Vadar_027653 [Vaccinium darrowii]|uniref:Uncharacterized protein n=1 Tax=Vaccinium darrowii TaxID=229202 RepID=A0ACB7YIL8_9ERIC|nr:hypothetical protein Vadar_027653 [Vaccinium darrowii]